MPATPVSSPSTSPAEPVVLIEVTPPPMYTSVSEEKPFLPVPDTFTSTVPSLTMMDSLPRTPWPALEVTFTVGAAMKRT